MTDDAFVHGEVSAGDEMHIDYEFLDDIEAEIDELKFSIGISTNFNFGRTGGAGIDESTYFKIEPISGKITDGDCLDYTKKLQDFLTLATRKQLTHILSQGTSNEKIIREVMI